MIASAIAACSSAAAGGALFPITFVVLQLVTNVYYHVAGLYPILGARWTARHRHAGELA